MGDDVDEVIRRIEATGTTLTAIYITHAHADHYFGLERLLERFPRRPRRRRAGRRRRDRRRQRRQPGRLGRHVQRRGARQHGDPRTPRRRHHHRRRRGAARHRGRAGRHPEQHRPAHPLDRRRRRRRRRSTTASTPSSPRPTPTAGAAGWRASPRSPSSSPASSWPATSVPNCPTTTSPRRSAPRRDYIRDFITEVEAASGSRDLVARMQRRYPDHGNPSALILSAVTALKRAPGAPDGPAPSRTTAVRHRSGDRGDHVPEQLEAADHRVVVARDVTDHHVRRTPSTRSGGADRRPSRVTRPAGGRSRRRGSPAPGSDRRGPAPRRRWRRRARRGAAPPDTDGRARSAVRRYSSSCSTSVLVGGVLGGEPAVAETAGPFDGDVVRAGDPDLRRMTRQRGDRRAGERRTTGPSRSRPRRPAGRARRGSSLRSASRATPAGSRTPRTRAPSHRWRRSRRSGASTNALSVPICSASSSGW